MDSVTPIQRPGRETRHRVQTLCRAVLGTSTECGSAALTRLLCIGERRSGNSGCRGGAQASRSSASLCLAVASPGAWERRSSLPVSRAHCSQRSMCCADDGGSPPLSRHCRRRLANQSARPTVDVLPLPAVQSVSHSPCSRGFPPSGHRKRSSSLPPRHQKPCRPTWPSSTAPVRRQAAQTPRRSERRGKNVRRRSGQASKSWTKT